MLLLGSMKLFLRKLLNRYVPPRYLCTNGTINEKEASLDDLSVIQNKNRIVWIDLEMSGLEVETDRILEVACLITDENLNIISDEFSMVLNQPDNLLNGMNEWCKNTHSKTGLTEASRNCQENETSVEKCLLNFMAKYIPAGKCPMAGNSVYVDRLFLRHYMPAVNNYVHYRIIDVTSIREIVKYWRPEIYKEIPKKDMIHRAMSDVKESIQELDFYKKNIFNMSSVPVT